MNLTFWNVHCDLQSSDSIGSVVTLTNSGKDCVQFSGSEGKVVFIEQRRNLWQQSEAPKPHLDCNTQICTHVSLTSPVSPAFKSKGDVSSIAQRWSLHLFIFSLRNSLRYKPQTSSSQNFLARHQELQEETLLPLSFLSPTWTCLNISL